MAGRSHKPTYWGSPQDEERKAAARVMGVLGRVGGLLGLAGPDWETAVAGWCAAEEKRRREEFEQKGAKGAKQENQEKTDEREADFYERGDGAGDSGGAEDADAAAG